MKKALYIIFIIATLVVGGFHVQMFIQSYTATTVTKSNLDTATIYNSDGSYLMLLNPGHSVSAENNEMSKNQKSILLTVPYNLKNARYIPLDGYYTKLDYGIEEYPNGIVTEINLYNSIKNEELTLEYNMGGASYSEPQTRKIDKSEIPDTKLTTNPNKDNKISLSKDNTYVEIPEYFEIVHENYSYVPFDFVQFTNISDSAEDAQ